MSWTIPHVLPRGYTGVLAQVVAPPVGQTGPPVVATPVDTGGYDILLGGFGFRLATDQQFAYTRDSDPITSQRVDQSREPGEQTLTPLPWVKSQSSFHGGAGQLNLEPAIQQPWDVSRLRFQMSRNADIWTPGLLQRLPDVTVTATAVAPECMTAGSVGGVDYAYVGGVGGFYEVAWTAGVDSPPVVTQVDLASNATVFVSNANCELASIASDGATYYAMLHLSTANGAGNRLVIASGAIGTSTTPTVLYQAVDGYGVLGWVKQRLMAGINNSLYELSVAGPALPAPKYTNPTTAFRWTAISESPTAVIASGDANGSNSSIVNLMLNTAGATPVLTGGTTIAVVPTGETIKSMALLVGSFIVMGTSRGVRVGTFDTYTGAMKYGPLTPVTPNPVLCVTGRDHFAYVGFTNGNEDGSTGLARVDLGMPVDQFDRLAWAPDLVPPPSAPTGHGAVVAVAVLPSSGRLVFASPDGVHVEGNGPGSVSPSWLRTSRIRYGIAESKLFLLAQVRGDFRAGQVGVIGTTPYVGAQTLSTLGPAVNADPPQFTLSSAKTEWLQLQFNLIGAPIQVTSYQVKALPAVTRQDVIQMTVYCMRSEMDRFGLTDVEPIIPRNRVGELFGLMRTGTETQLVEFTPLGPVVTEVVVENIRYTSFARPTKIDDYGGFITLQMRTTRL